MRLAANRAWILEIALAVLGILAVISMGGGWILVVAIAVAAAAATVATRRYRSRFDLGTRRQRSSGDRRR